MRSISLPPYCTSVTHLYGCLMFRFELPAGHRRVSFAPMTQSWAEDTLHTKELYNLYFPPTVCHVFVNTKPMFGYSQEYAVQNLKWVTVLQGHPRIIPLPNMVGNVVCGGGIYGETITSVLEQTLAKLWVNFNLDILGNIPLNRSISSHLSEWEQTPPDQVGLNWTPTELPLYEYMPGISSEPLRELQAALHRTPELLSNGHTLFVV